MSHDCHMIPLMSCDVTGIYGVGKAAEHKPALVVLSHTPSGAEETISWVGKGIVYDTGGLSIKGKVGEKRAFLFNHSLFFYISLSISRSTHALLLPRPTCLE